MDLELVFDAVLAGDANGVEQGVQALLDGGSPAEKILQEGLIRAMQEVGKRFEEGEFFVPEMLIAARAMQAGLALLKPYLAEADVKSSGKVVIGTVSGDLHDIGKNLVGMMLEGAGFEVVDLGTDVAPEIFVEAIKDGADILGLSALLTTTMPMMASTIDAVVQAGLRNQVKILVGGAPVTQQYADQIEADGYAADASRAASLAGELIGK